MYMQPKHPIPVHVCEHDSTYKQKTIRGFVLVNLPMAVQLLTPANTPDSRTSSALTSSQVQLIRAKPAAVPSPCRRCQHSPGMQPNANPTCAAPAPVLDPAKTLLRAASKHFPSAPSKRLAPSAQQRLLSPGAPRPPPRNPGPPHPGQCPPQSAPHAPPPCASHPAPPPPHPRRSPRRAE